MSITRNTTRTIFTSFAMIALSAANAYADDTNAPEKLTAIYQCMGIQADTDRLSCFDKTVAEFQSAKNSGQIIAVSKVELEKATKEGFGFNIPSLSSLGKIFKSGDGEKDEDDASKSVELTIDRTKRIGSTKLRFYFTNGQIWEQTTAEKIFVPKVKNDVPNTALIKKAAFGSYLMRVNGKSRGIRVKRVD